MKNYVRESNKNKTLRSEHSERNKDYLDNFLIHAHS